MIELKNSYYEAVTIDLTYRCNLRCRHCFNYSGEHTVNDSEMTDQELIDLCHAVVKIKPEVVCLCGGEPLLRKEVLFKMIEILKGGNIENVNMVSNGYILDLEIAKELKKRGIDFVQISVDGVVSNTHDWLRNKQGSFDKAIEAIKNLVKSEVKVGVSFIPTKRSIEEMQDLIMKLDELGVEIFRTQPLMNMGRALSISENDYPDSFDYFKMSQKITHLSMSPNLKNMKLEWGDPLEHLGLFAEGGVLRMLMINGYGDILISPYLPIKIGNIRKHSIKEYIRHGLLGIYSEKCIKDLSKKYSRISEMNLSGMIDKFPELYKDDFVDLDIIDMDENKRTEILNKITEVK